MPGGVPVATMAVGKAGAKNAALFTARLMALEDKNIGDALDAYIKKMAADVDKKHKNLSATRAAAKRS